MKRRYPSHLKLHRDDSHSEERSTEMLARNRSRSYAGLEQDEIRDVLKAFSEATSWSITSRVPPSELNNTEINNKVPAPHVLTGLRGRRWRLVESMIHDSILDASDLQEISPVPMDRAQELLLAIERLIDRLESAEETLRRQEAELATSVGLTSQPDRNAETADRLESILDSTSRTIGACAAAIYLLDDETTSLKMRACIGLPRSRLTLPPRPLKGSLGDLEALLGNAVLLSDIEMMPEWPSPEDYGAAIVAPIGSATMPYGTVWFWSETNRTYDATEIEVVNLATGRIMAEIEHLLLGEELQHSREIKKQIDTASLTQASLLPDHQKLHDDFDIDGWTFQNGSLGGGFHHWELTSNKNIGLLLGNANQQGPEGALVATSIQAVTRTLWRQQSNVANIMRSLNDQHWGLQDADWKASLGLIQVNPGTGYGSICTAGKLQAFVVSERGFRPLGQMCAPLGSQPEAPYVAQRFVLQPNEILIAYTSDILTEQTFDTRLRKPQTRRTVPYTHLCQTSLLQIVRDMHSQKSSDIAGFLARTLPTFERDENGTKDRSLVVIKNNRKPRKR